MKSSIVGRMPTTDPDRRGTATEQAELIDALVQTSFVTIAVLSTIGAAHDLSLTQLRVLAILQDRRLRMTDLARYLGLDKSTMTGLVTRAEKRGLLMRAASLNDGRSVDVLLSDDGRALAARLFEEAARLLAPMTSRLDLPGRRNLSALLTGMLTEPS
ncbi:hypothetical protein BH10ACT8_BH10ACT8_20760 [soil metagenome]|jgi:DNA-binding MarR family transcriptional regulator